MVVFGGDQVVADNYNRLLYADGKGLLPGRRSGRASATPRRRRRPSASTRSATGTRSSPSSQARPTPVTAGLTEAQDLAVPQAQAPHGLDRPRWPWRSTTATRRSIEAPRHRGTVIQVATSADAGWTTWPLHQSYPPVMEQIVLQAASGRLAERNVRVGQPLDQALPAVGGGGRRSRSSRPTGQTVAAKLQAGRRRQPAPLRGDRPVRAVPGQDRAAAGARVDVRRQPRPGRERPRQARPGRAGRGRSRAGTSLYLTNWKELTAQRRVGRPPRRAAPAVALRRARPAAGRIDPGLEVRTS